MTRSSVLHRDLVSDLPVVVPGDGTKAPFDPDEGIAMKIVAAAKSRGAMTNPAQGCIDGINGGHVLLAPAYTTNAEEIDLIVETLTLAVAGVLDC